MREVESELGQLPCYERYKEPSTVMKLLKKRRQCRSENARSVRVVSGGDKDSISEQHITPAEEEPVLVKSKPTSLLAQVCQENSYISSHLIPTKRAVVKKIDTQAASTQVF